MVCVCGGGGCVGWWVSVCVCVRACVRVRALCKLAGHSKNKNILRIQTLLITHLGLHGCHLSLSTPGKLQLAIKRQNLRLGF